MIHGRIVLAASLATAFASVCAAQSIDIVSNIPALNPNPNGPYEHLETDANAQRLTTLVDEEEEVFQTFIGNAVFPSGLLLVGRNGGVAYPTILGNDLNRSNAPLPSALAFNGSRTAAVYWDDIGNHRDGSGTWGLNRQGIERGIVIIQWRGTLPGDPPPPFPLVDFELQVFNPPISFGGVDVYGQILFDTIDRGIPNDSGASATIGFQAEPTALPPITTDNFSVNLDGAVTNGTVLSVIIRAACAVDFNGDGFVDYFDFADFVDCFDGLACPPGKSCDFNGDETCDFLDMAAFIEAFESGC